VDSDSPRPPGAYKKNSLSASSSTSDGSGKNGKLSSKDIRVELGVLETEEMKRGWSGELRVPGSWPFGKMRGEMRLVNKGSMAVYREVVKLNPKLLSLDREEVEVKVLSPYGVEKVELVMTSDKWSWYGASMELEFETGEKSEVKLPVWVEYGQLVILLGGGGALGYGLYRISKGLESIRKKTGRKG
jgi:hypothetical protein